MLNRLGIEGRMRRPASIVAAVLMGFGAAAVHAAAGETYPTKPIRIVVPYPAGGGTDMLGRAIAEKLTQRLATQIVVDNRPGAGTNIGTGLVAKATPDGYTLLLAGVPLAINPALYESLPYDPERELEPITLVASSTLVLLAHPSVKANSVRELIDLAKSNPGKLNFSSIGSGTSSHLAGELFKSMTGSEMVHIPYKGSAPALTALLGGQVQLMFSTMLSGMPHIQSGKLRPLGVSSLKRAPVLPNVPAIAETIPGFETVVWYGLLAPAGTPRPVLARLHAECVGSLKSPDVVKRFEAEGADIVANSPQEFAAYLKTERTKWARVVRQSGAKVD